ncbi:MAG: sigma-70 family RNA polymerase sigma factor [Bacteroidales bacterium]|nr:sigma-70 family RNA polymerase sigma factor [Bacteroidales bacterium]
MVDFKNIIKEHHPILYKIGRIYSHDSAGFDDLYQEMLIQVYQSLHSFSGNARLSTWIYRVALNTALTHQRNEKKHAKVVTDERIEEQECEEEPQKIAEQREQKIEMLYKSIRKLQPEDRGLIMLQLEGKKYDEIAAVIGISASHVGVKLLRARKKLENFLREDGYEHI